jgi:hypothetical protein
MSYDISLNDPVSGKTLQSESLHDAKGGLYVQGGLCYLHLNVTYNYRPHFVATLGEHGIRTIYSMTGLESQPLLKAAIAKLGDNTTKNYYEATEGNVKRALSMLLMFATMRPDGVWSGD